MLPLPPPSFTLPLRVSLVSFALNIGTISCHALLEHANNVMGVGGLGDGGGFQTQKLLNITRMIQKREVMKREQLLVQQEIFLQQHYDLTDTTGEARPLSIRPGTYRARPRQLGSASIGAGGAVAPPATAAAGQAAGPGSAGGSGVTSAVGEGSVAGVSSSVSQVRKVRQGTREFTPWGLKDGWYCCFLPLTAALIRRTTSLT